MPSFSQLMPLVFALMSALVVTAGCGEPDDRDKLGSRDDSKVPSSYHTTKDNSKTSGAPVTTLTKQELEDRIKAAGKDETWVTREHMLNNFREPYQFTIQLPEDVKDDWLGDMKLHNTRNLAIELNFVGWLDNPAVLESDEADDKKLIAQTDDAVVFQYRYSGNLNFRMRIPLGYLELHSEWDSAEPVKPTLDNIALAIKCLRTIRPRMQIEEEPIEILRQLDWRLIERDGKVVEIWSGGHGDFTDHLSSPRCITLLENFKHVKLLRMRSSFFMDDTTCDTIAKLQSLEAVELQPFGDTDITGAGFKQLINMPNLHTLHLISGKVNDDDIAMLEGNTQLKHFKLHGSLKGLQIKEKGLEHLAKLQQLETLALDFHSLTDPMIAKLAPLKNLRHLSLSGHYSSDEKLTDAVIETILGFENLESLNLSSTKLTDEGLLKLAALKSLKRLKINNTGVTEKGKEKLKEALPQLEFVRD